MWGTDFTTKKNLVDFLSADSPFTSVSRQPPPLLGQGSAKLQSPKLSHFPIHGFPILLKLEMEMKGNFGRAPMPNGRAEEQLRCPVDRYRPSVDRRRRVGNMNTGGREGARFRLRRRLSVVRSARALFPSSLTSWSSVGGSVGRWVRRIGQITILKMLPLTGRADGRTPRGGRRMDARIGRGSSGGGMPSCAGTSARGLGWAA